MSSLREVSMAPKTIIQADIDERLKTKAASVLKSKGLSLNMVLEMAATKNSLFMDMLAKKKAAEAEKSLTAAPTPSKSKKTTDLKKLPGFGMWAGRADMENPAEWVRNLRKPRCQDDF